MIYGPSVCETFNLKSVLVLTFCQVNVAWINTYCSITKRIYIRRLEWVKLLHYVSANWTKEEMLCFILNFKTHLFLFDPWATSSTGSTCPPSLGTAQTDRRLTSVYRESRMICLRCNRSREIFYHTFISKLHEGKLAVERASRFRWFWEEQSFAISQKFFF